MAGVLCCAPVLRSHSWAVQIFNAIMTINKTAVERLSAVGAIPEVPTPAEPPRQDGATFVPKDENTASARTRSATVPNVPNMVRSLACLRQRVA